MRSGSTRETIDVATELDTSTSAWTVASGNYSSRFSGVGAGAVHLASLKVAAKLRTIAAAQLGCDPAEVELREGTAWYAGESVGLRRLAGIAHWHPESLPAGVEPGLHETAFYGAPNLAAPDADDRVASSAAHGFIVDVAVVEVDRDTGRRRGARLHDGQRCRAAPEPAPRGGPDPRRVRARRRGGALRAGRVRRRGNLLTGTFMDYLCPTAPDLPRLRIGHRESPSPFTPLGAKGLGEGTTMSTPVAIANAVADAIGRDDVEVPLTAGRVLGAPPVKPPPFEYVRATSVEEALSALAEPAPMRSCSPAARASCRC